MKKITLIASLLIWAYQNCYAQKIEDFDTLYINIDEQLKLKVEVVWNKDLTDIGDLNPLWNELVKNTDHIVNNLTNKEFPIAIEVKIAPDKIWSTTIRNHEKHGKEYSFNTNGKLIENQITKDTIIIKLPEKRTLKFEIKDISLLHNYKNLDLDSLISLLSKSVSEKRKISKKVKYSGQFNYTNYELNKVKETSYGMDQIALQFAPKLSLLKGSIQPGFTTSLSYASSDRQKNKIFELGLRAEFIYPFESNEFLPKRQTMLKTFYKGDQLKPIIGVSGVNAGVLIQNAGTFFERNLYVFGLEFKVKNHLFIGLDFNWENDFKTFYPGITFSF